MTYWPIKVVLDNKRVVGLGAIGKSEGILANERFVKHGGAEVVLANEKAVGLGWAIAQSVDILVNDSVLKLGCALDQSEYILANKE